MTAVQKAEPATLYIARHGQTHANVGDITDGHFNSDLTEFGETQARELGAKLKDISFAAVFSSDLIRARRTAEIAMLEKKLLVNTTELLRERYFGTYEGAHHSKFRAENQEILDRIQKQTHAESKSARIPSVETTEEMLTRFFTVLREISVSYAGKNVLIVTHGGILQSLLLHLGWVERREEIPIRCIENTAYIKLSSDGVDFQILELSGITRAE